ncbi:MAG: hypothetical protein LV481_00935, partial [Methylacidiphilales bacterium]|nr:hypothetical protein [Candidatus Methylacidiphilales bacterium]
AESQDTQVQIPGELDPARKEQVRLLLGQAGIDPAGIRFSRPRLSLEQLYLRTIQTPPGASNRDSQPRS